MKIIDNNTIFDIQKKYSEYTNVVILGKGPTFSNFNPTIHKNDFIIGVNDSINLADCDMLVSNDYETYQRLDKKQISKIKYILCPCFPRVKEQAYLDTTHDKIVNMFSSHYNNFFIPFNLRGDKFNSNFISLPSHLSGGNTAGDFIQHFMPNINNVICYGIGMINQPKYHDSFNKETSGYYRYNNTHLQNIRDLLSKTLNNKILLFK